jgi:hypothetical protein
LTGIDGMRYDEFIARGNPAHRYEGVKMRRREFGVQCAGDCSQVLTPEQIKGHERQTTSNGYTDKFYCEADAPRERADAIASEVNS